jgi:S-DNA-T family DNA segregation ATPase FtsK/SpoIIIE
VNVPGTRRWRLTPAGYSFTVRHRYGQDTETVRAAASVLASGLSAAQVRVVSETTGNGLPRRDRCRVIVNRRDPFQHVPGPLGLSPTRVRLGVLEDGRDWVYDARAFPHLLGAGATGSGKSSLQNTFLAALAPLDQVAVCLVDLKHGVSAEPYRPRASVIAETQTEAAGLLADLLALGRARAAVCKAQGVDSVYDLRAIHLPEVYVLIDEVAELTYDDGTPDGKALAKACLRDLLRAVSLLRAFGIHVWVLGQRFGSSLGPQITSIRAQLPGRVCLGVADRETGDMAVGDLAPEAVRAALDITLPGVCVIKGGPDRWQMGRAAHTSHADLARVAHRHTAKRIGWGLVMGEAADTHTTTELPAITAAAAVDPITSLSKESVS